MKKYGLELEFFLKKEGTFAFVPRGHYKLPVDDNGYLAEARGEPHEKPCEAVHLLRAQIRNLHKLCDEEGYKLLHLDSVRRKEFPKNFFTEALRAHRKKGYNAYFAHGGRYNDRSPVIRAGLHLHFSNSTTQTYGKNNEHSFIYPAPMNMPRIIFLLDKAFEKEIKKAGRVGGEYEMKHHGFEYRSLPATTDLDKVIEVLEEIHEENL